MYCHTLHLKGIHDAAASFSGELQDSNPRSPKIQVRWFNGLFCYILSDLMGELSLSELELTTVLGRKVQVV
jgi:hypothetical protein